MYYSPSKNGFYSKQIHGNAMPSDSIQISDDEYRALIAGQSQGKMIAIGSNGRPVLKDPPPQPVTVPQSVTRFQARAALHLAGHLQQIEVLMSAPEMDMLARLAWQDAQEFRRTSPTVAAMAQALGLTDAQVDQLFITARGIEA